MKKSYLLLCVVIVATAGLAVADDGFWPFNAVPKDKIKTRYGFEPTQQWLDHVRLSSVKFSGASGSFVSPDGLVLTNHHVGASCIHDVSTANKDYIKNGFYASAKADEIKCPNMSVSVLQDIEDITPKLKAAVTPDMSPAQAAKTQKALESKLTKECSTTTKLTCQAVPFYSGATHFLYKYKTYEDVRLVFAPEYAMAFLGGDPDNFEYPRYALDVTFFRIYEGGKPLHTENHLSWSKKGVKTNDLVFTSGHPGMSARLNTMAQLEFMRDLDYPRQVERRTRIVEGLLQRGAASAEAQRQVEEALFAGQNGLKAAKGHYSGLLDKRLMATKAEQEKRLRDAILSDPKLKAQFGDPWKDVADYYNAQREGNLYLKRQFFPDPQPPAASRRPGSMAGVMPGMLPSLARLLVLTPIDRAMPEAERDPVYAPESMQKRLFGSSKIDKASDIRMLTTSLAEMVKYLKDDPIVAKLLNGKTPAEAAKEWIENTQVGDAEFRRRLYEGGKEAVEKSTDPLILAVRLQETEAFRIKDEWNKKVAPLARAADAAKIKLAQARFAVEGTKSSPDANSTLRLSYGAVKGYVEDGRGTVPKGTKLAPFTTLGQAYDYAAKHENKDPYFLPESWLKAKSKVNLKVPLNLVSTNDVLGGNSGSPLINKNAEIVGLIFDGNIQSLPGTFHFDETLNRSVSVDSRGIMEALRNVYSATALADELLDEASKPQSSKK
ncbi:MAG TPA: S46 family peptidase [Clostridia bacterium]|nr:S46 family peptidase [Clostridia bacterium]